MVILYSTVAFLGLCGVVVGFWGQAALKSPYDTLAAVLLPLSLVVGLGAVLLLCVPRFFF
ncbi:MAG: hypothetical protein VST69_04390 [Nitrospirota bacterium]|nr:hypothetical protein [Nitrospirota bacterium]